MDTRFVLPQEQIPTAWYNALPDLPEPLQPPLHPGTKEPVGPDDLAPLFPMALIEQEMTGAPAVDIPGAVLDIYRLWRPTPLVRARRLEEALGTPARIYFKDESVSPAGSHKPNTAVAQAFYNKEDGTTRLATETGAGQWGSALALACSLFDMKCEVFMVGASYDQKPYRRTMMETFGARVHRSPSDQTAAGRAIRAAVPSALWNVTPSGPLWTVTSPSFVTLTSSSPSATRAVECLRRYWSRRGYGSGPPGETRAEPGLACRSRTASWSAIMAVS